jgi:RNA polymerase sigma factor (sigma-70 family)
MAFLRSDRRENIDDAELVSRYRFSHDTSYVGELFQRYTHMVFGVCLRYLKDEELARDAVMAVFEKVMSDLKKHEVDNFRTWVYSVSKNHCLMALRKERTLIPHKENYKHFVKEIMETDDPLHLNGASEVEMDKRLEEAIISLNEDQQKCIRLFYFEKRSYEDIEEMTPYNYKQVKSHLQNGKRNLKIKLSQSDA